MRYIPLDKVIEAIEQSNDSKKSRFENNKELRERINAIEPVNIYPSDSPKPREHK